MSQVNQESMPKTALSARAIDKMKVGDADKSDIGENSGLRVSCGKTGKKSFFYRYRSPINNQITQIKLGTYPEMSLAEARVELRRLKIERNSGICPKQKMEQARLEAKALVDAQEAFIERITLRDMVEKYLLEVIEDRYVKDLRSGEMKKIDGGRKPKGQAETRRTLYGDAVRVLGNRLAEEVTRKDVVSMIKAIIDRGAKVQAGRVLSELTSAYEYAIGLELFAENFANPALLAKENFKQARVKLTSDKGRRVFSDNDLREVLAWLPGSGFSDKQKSILKLTLWTGCRTGEVCAAEWNDFDLIKKTWHMRASKNETERYVRLSDQCVAFLQELKSGDGRYLFCSGRTGLPILQKTLTETKWRLKNPDKIKNQQFKPEQLWLKSVPDWSPHDLRRTVRTGLSRLGCPSEVAEAVLGHSKKGIEGTYNLHKYEKECLYWLQRWADYLDVLELNTDSVDGSS